MPFIAPGEHRKFAALVAAMVVVCHVRRKRIQKRWLAEGEEPKWQDHPAVPYLVENASVWTAAYLAQTLVALPDRSRPGPELFRNLLRGWLVVDGLIVLQKLLCATLYSHVPYFSLRKPAEDWRTVLADYARTNLPNDVFGGLVLMYTQKPAAPGSAAGATPIRLAPFLAKFLVGRLIVDVTFGLVHWAMHASPTFYSKVHKRHHEHTAPRSQTNFHFEIIDLFLEGGAPVVTQVLLMRLLGIKVSLTEQAVMTGSYIYFESASHAGKEYPAVTWFPLLSPVVGWLTGMDDRLVEYHTRHHQLYNCNYSIAPWPDKLMGTYRIDLPEAYANIVVKEKAGEVGASEAAVVVAP